MSSISPSIASLDESLAKAYESLRKLEVADSIDVDKTIDELKTAAKSARKLRAMVSSELPNASWENREELDALIVRNSEKFQRNTGRWYFSFLRLARGQ
ncbi:MAG TPA: hypothetical protein VLW48_03315 [Candidatus Bathyarchaeia archaeon]|nr:hypothetical protein [Candidatus Bathyarchaeia archaeon]